MNTEKNSACLSHEERDGAQLSIPSPQELLSFIYLEWRILIILDQIHKLNFPAFSAAPNLWQDFTELLFKVQAIS